MNAFIIKYDSSHTLLWYTVWNGKNIETCANGIVIHFERCYVVGYIFDPDHQNKDIFIKCFEVDDGDPYSGGNPYHEYVDYWPHQNDPDFGDDVAYAVDYYEGRLFVTGYSTQDNTGYFPGDPQEYGSINKDIIVLCYGTGLDLKWSESRQEWHSNEYADYFDWYDDWAYDIEIGIDSGTAYAYIVGETKGGYGATFYHTPNGVGFLDILRISDRDWVLQEDENIFIYYSLDDENCARELELRSTANGLQCIYVTGWIAYDQYIQYKSFVKKYYPDGSPGWFAKSLDGYGSMKGKSLVYDIDFGDTHIILIGAIQMDTSTWVLLTYVDNDDAYDFIRPTYLEGYGYNLNSINVDCFHDCIIIGYITSAYSGLLSDDVYLEVVTDYYYGVKGNNYWWG